MLERVVYCLVADTLLEIVVLLVCPRTSRDARPEAAIAGTKAREPENRQEQKTTRLGKRNFGHTTHEE